MLKHFIDAFTNTYYILEDDVVVFSVDLNRELVDVKGCINTYQGDIKKLELKRHAELENITEW